MESKHHAVQPVSPLPAAYIDRRLTRMLWKLVQIEPGEVYLVPSKRLIALLALFGQIGYPEYILRTTLRGLATGMSLSNRSPFEIPASLIVSMCPIPASETVPILLWLSKLGLLSEYTEESIPVEIPRFGLAENLPRDWLAARLEAMIDTRDRMLGSMLLNFEEDLTGYESVIATLISTAEANAGYPALLIPEVTERWLNSKNSSLQPAAQMELELLSRMPNRLISFADLMELLRHPAVEMLRSAVARRVAGELDAPVDPALASILKELELRGFSYRDAILHRGDFSPLSDPVGDFPTVSPADAALDFAGSLPTVIMHLASTAAAGLGPASPLILVPGTELWVPNVDDMMMVSIYSNRQLGDPRRSAFLYECL